MIAWAKVTREDYDTIKAIVDRAETLTVMRINRMDLTMDLGAAHSHTPMDLEKLLYFDDFSFAHDIDGISNCIDRNTGELRNCFLPRCAR